MGLDIYVIDIAQAAAEDAENAAWDAWQEGNPHPASAPARSRGVSRLHPDHMFTPTYARSSYNSGGFNHRVPLLLGDSNTTLHDIFAPIIAGRDDQYAHDITDAKAVRKVQANARTVAARLRAIANPLSVYTVDIVNVVASELDALAWYRHNREGQLEGPMAGHGWSDRDGDMMPPGGITVLAAVPGVGILGKPCVHLVTAVEDDDVKWYADAAEILAEEFCATMLDLIARDGKCRVIWSG